MAVLIETIPSLILGAMILFFLDNRVADAKWLTSDEKQIITHRLVQESGGHDELSALSDALRSGRVWLLGVAYFCYACAIYVTSFWLPTLIRARGIADPLHIGLLTAVPYIVGMVAMYMTNAHADRTRERRWHAVVPCMLAGLGLVLSALPGTSLVVGMLALTLATAGACSALAAFWSLPAAFLSGAAAAAGIALINSLGNLAGFASTTVIGKMSDTFGSTAPGLYLFGAVVLLGGTLVLFIPARLVNK